MKTAIIQFSFRGELRTAVVEQYLQEYPVRFSVSCNEIDLFGEYGGKMEYFRDKNYVQYKFVKSSSKDALELHHAIIAQIRKMK